MNRNPRAQSMLAAATIAALLLAALAPAASQGWYSELIGYIGGPICEGNRTAFKLSCTAYNASYVIQNIDYAFYGRDNNVSCPYGSPVPSPAMTNTSCSYAKAVSDITSQCYGMHECSPLFLSDPCVGTYKYMRAAYKCGPPDGTDQYTVGPVCDNQPFTLSCPAAKVIVDSLNGTINSAFYGRSDPTQCNFGGVTNNSCILPSALSEVSLQCIGKQTCSPTFSADPCYGTYKTRSAGYYCMWASLYAQFHGVTVIETSVCDGESFNLTCSAGKVIDVYNAFYGSDNDHFACYNYPLGNTNCSLPSALSEVTSQCEGKQTCFPSFSADPCYGTYKTKYVQYGCI